MKIKEAISRIEGILDLYPFDPPFSVETCKALEMAIDALKAQLSQEGTTCDSISRQMAINAVDAIGHIATMPDGDKCIRKSGIKYVLSMLPSDQPERKTGHWIAPKYYPTQFTYTCSECGYKQSFNGKFKFCPSCGADMRGKN